MEFNLTKRLPAFPEVTQEALNLYFSYLSLKGAKRYAAIMAGIEPTVIRRMIKKDTELAERQEEALEEYREHIDMEIHRRAIDGVKKTVWFKGNAVGTDIVTSDRLLEFMARANNPNKYRDQLQIDANVKAGVLVVNATLDPDDWEKQYGDMRTDKTRVESVCPQQDETEK